MNYNVSNADGEIDNFWQLGSNENSSYALSLSHCVAGEQTKEKDQY